MEALSFDPMIAERNRMFWLRDLCAFMFIEENDGPSPELGGLGEIWCQFFDDIDIEAEDRPWVLLDERQTRLVRELARLLDEIGDAFDDLDEHRPEVFSHPAFAEARLVARQLAPSLPQRHEVDPGKGGPHA